MGCAASTSQTPEAPQSTELPKAAPEPVAQVKARPTNKRIGDMLKDVPVLLKLKEEQRNLLGGAMTEQEYRDGEPVFRQGDAGKNFYIILEGHADVLVTETSGKTNKIGHLTQGDYFGETALQNDAARGASIIASGNLKCLSLSKEHFVELVGSADVQFVRRRIGISAEADDGDAGSSSANDSHMPSANAVREKTEEVRRLIYNAVVNSLLFNGLSEDHINAVIDSMYVENIKAGVSPIKQGDPGNNLYIVEKGEFDVFVRKEDGKSINVANRGPGEIFGELALMYNAPRAATVTAKTDSVVWKVDRFTFRRIARNVGDGELKKRVQFLSRIELLSSLTTFERSKIAEAMEEVTFAKDHVIFKQGDHGEAMYIVVKGEVVISKREPGENEAQVVNRTCGGDYFGERALLMDEPRAATVKTVSAVSALELKRHAFKLLLGPLKDIMQARIDGYDKEPNEEENAAAVDKKQEENYFDETLKFEDLQVLGTLGKGSFGHVQLCKHKKTGMPYALKGVNKQQIVDTHQQEHILSEKRVMMRMNHPFLIRLYQTFKDKNTLYFVLEPVMGGELFSLLRRRRLFKETTAQFYAGAVISAFGYMHSRDTVYRDLKPENLLLDEQGFIKITDFGFAKRIGNGKTWTLCGTPDYLAPEIVSGRGHGKGVDWWTVGVLIYEMIASYTPFYHQNQLKMYDKIVRGKYKFPSHFSRSAKQIVAELLEHKPTKRLGVIAGGVKMIRNHEWFENFDWDALENKTMKAPIIMPLKDKFDMSNFDVYDDDQHEHIRPYRDDGSNWDAEF